MSNKTFSKPQAMHDVATKYAANRKQGMPAKTALKAAMR